jgi:hypothetical protein
MQSFAVTEPACSRILAYVCSGAIPPSWNQPFVFKEHTNCLRQFRGGPCGLIAAVQAHILILLRSHPDWTNNDLLQCAVLDIMWLLRSCYVFCDAFDAPSLHWQATQDRAAAATFLRTEKWLSQPTAVTLFTISLAILVGSIWLRHFSIPDRFITENGQTTPPLVLLMISGEFFDSYHDGNLLMGGIVIKGAVAPVTIGVVSISEFQVYQKLGTMFANPTEKIWIG